MTAPVPVMPRPDRPRDGRAIYVAGASAERERIARYMGALRDAGWTVTEDWPTAEAASGKTDAELDDATATRAALRDIEGVARAGVFWLVAPGVPSFGAPFELGVAVALRRAAISASQRIRIVISGDAPSIFARLADERYPTHLEALAVLTGYAFAPRVSNG